VAKFSVSLISGGRLFQISWPGTENALRPNCVLVHFAKAARVVDDRRRRTAVSLSLIVTMSVRYAGHQRCRQRCISAASLNKTVLDRQPVQSLQRRRDVCWSVETQYQPRLHSALVAVVPATTLVGRRVRRCSSQCE